MFEIFRPEGLKGAWLWRLRLAAGGRVLCVADQSFAKRSAAIADIKRVQALAPGAQTVEVL